MAVPGVTPHILFEGDTVATVAGVQLQVPNGGVAATDMQEPTQVTTGPVIGPGDGLTVRIVVT